MRLAALRLPRFFAWTEARFATCVEWEDPFTLSVEVALVPDPPLPGHPDAAYASIGVSIPVPTGIASTVARLVRRWTDAVFVPGSGV